MRIATLTLAMLLAPAGAAFAQGTDVATDDHPIIVLGADIRWQSGPASLPPGAQMAVLMGDPGEPGPFTMRLRLPANYRIPPHFHQGDEVVTVISGTFHVGMGETFDEAHTVALTAGSYGAFPTGMAHYAFTRVETVIQLNNVGPWAVTYVNPADDPRRD
jgi:hypothetical protein